MSKYNVDNTVKSMDGKSLEVYSDHMHELADEYIYSVLKAPEDIAKKQPFAGMIKYIAKRIAPVNLDDLVLLNNIWDVYAELCYIYNQTVSIERYCILIGIHRDTFYSWYKGETRNAYCEELGCSRSDIIKKFDKESENSWQDEASTGNPGSMFVLKARRGWNEQAPAIGASEDAMLNRRTAAEIQADYVLPIEQKESESQDVVEQPQEDTR